MSVEYNYPSLNKGSKLSSPSQSHSPNESRQVLQQNLEEVQELSDTDTERDDSQPTQNVVEKQKLLFIPGAKGTGDALS